MHALLGFIFDHVIAVSRGKRLWADKKDVEKCGEIERNAGIEERVAVSNVGQEVTSELGRRLDFALYVDD